MHRFLEREKLRQAEFRASSPYFSESARAKGPYRNEFRPFCLPVEFAEENLAPRIREAALSHFARHHIRWHDGQNGKPSNHLCSSQVCCINFLFPFSSHPVSLAQLLRCAYPEAETMLPVESDQYVSFEWIGLENYLGEKVSRNGRRTRGANFTSADAIVMFERQDKKRQIVLIEWKYTESYGNGSLKYAKSGIDRTGIYRQLYEKPDCPINRDILPGFDSLFYEPFYQFMRQQFLANEMEKSHELGADVVSVLHIAPACNRDFQKITSHSLESLGESSTATWKKLVRKKDRFVSIGTETLFGDLSAEQFPEMRSWLDYIYARYPWVATRTVE